MYYRTQLAALLLFFQAEDGIRYADVTGVQTCALPILKRGLNEGFSGAEKKKNEVFQMAVLEPKFCVLDETDSGLDIDALRLVANGINAMRSPKRAMLVVTHYQRLLDYVVPDVVHVLVDGKIVKSGDADLARNLEKHGYGSIL